MIAALAATAVHPLLACHTFMAFGAATLAFVSSSGLAVIRVASGAAKIPTTNSRLDHPRMRSPQV